jgi:tetratricopeptide (TPR) repeat protein/transcriptional regulator with XRE-family HTH domain
MSGGSPDGFGDLVRRRRVVVGLTQQGLAERTGLSVRAICDIERGYTARPRRASVVLLSGALGLAGSGSFDQRLTAGADAMDAPAPPAELADRSAADGRPPGSVVPRQLPAAVRHFVGRTRELQALDELLGQVAGEKDTAVIAVIGGSAGVGKTTLAVHWAHKAAEHFPDGQLYLNLRGFDRSGTMVTSADAVRRLLDALQVPAAQIPANLEAQADLYRSLMAGKRVLVVLDNARDDEQVRPLLPGTPGCLAVVTSRTQLVGLVASHDALSLTLGPLASAEARELLASRLGSDRIRTESAAVDKVIALCARLPLALAIVAARVVLGPPDLITSLTHELEDARSRLAALDAGDVNLSAQTVFSWSYQCLSEPAARMFRLLGLLPGPDISGPAAASLANVGAGQARTVLQELARANLVSEHPCGRYAFHDLLHGYARDLAHATDSEHDRRLAFHRALDYYLYSARAAAHVLHPSHDQSAVPPPQAGVIEQSFSGSELAIAWFEAERQVMVAMIAPAVSAGLDTQVVRLAAHLSGFLNRGGYLADLAATQQAALGAAERVGDGRGQARARRMLGQVSTELGDFDEARQQFGYALELEDRFGNCRSQGRAVCTIAFALIQQGSFAEALAECRRALELFQEGDDRCGQAAILNNMAWCLSQLGSHEQAAAHSQRSISLYHELKDLYGESAAWDTLGVTQHCRRDYVAAAESYQMAIRLAVESSDRSRLAESLSRLGDVHSETGSVRAARDAWTSALEILEDLPGPEADQVRGKLENLVARPPHPDIG